MSRAIVPETDRIGRLLSLAYGRWQAETYEQLGESGFPDIRPAYSPIFRLVAPEGSRTVELAAQAGMTKQSMGYLVDALAKSGYVELVSDPQDGRAKLVRLTERGNAAHRKLVKLSRSLESDLAERIGSDRVEILRETLLAIVDR